MRRFPSLLPRSLVLAAALVGAGLMLTACQTSGRGTAAGAMASGDRTTSNEDNSAAAMRRLFSPLKTRPSDR